MTQVSNPFSTGGGGTTFVQLEGMYYLADLLARAVPRGLGSGICSRVAFQQRWAGVELDDIVIETDENGITHSLALQAKHKITFSDASSNKIFAEVMTACWRTFTNQTSWKFDAVYDRIGIVSGTYNASHDTYLQPLLELARISTDCQNWINKTATAGAVADQ